MKDETRKRYRQFLESKRILADPCGFDVPESEINPMMRGRFGFQQDICRWGLRRGKAAVFAHTGLGKGPIQLEWCKHVARHTERPTIILAPQAVAEQFDREAVKFHVPLTHCQDDGDVRPGVNVTNYDRLHKFDLERFGGVSLDESSCIKDWTSKTTQTLIDRLARTPFKLACTATPSPNDHAELGTHAELLDVMRRAAMLAMFFEHDGGQTSKWALKGHGKKPFFKFVSSWAVCVQRPSDLGYPDEGFDLPLLHTVEHIVPVDHSIATEGMLFRCPDLSATGLHKELRLTADDRAAKVAEIVRASPGVPWIIWCNTDYEAKAVRAALPEVSEIKGSDKPEKKVAAILQFLDGDILELLSKPEIFGFGLNLQHCWNMAFMGLGYSFEKVFQAIRRCWRFGQTREVYAHMVIAETEGPVLAALHRKQRQYEELQAEMNEVMREEQLATRHKKTRYDHTKKMRIPEWLISQ